MSVDGDWIVTAHTPKGDYPWALSLTTTEGGQVSGTLDIGDSVVAIEDGVVDGGTITWTSHMQIPRTLTFSGRASVDGDRIHGQVSMGVFGTRSFGGTRAPRDT